LSHSGTGVVAGEVTIHQEPRDTLFYFSFRAVPFTIRCCFIVHCPVHALNTISSQATGQAAGHNLPGDTHPFTFLFPKPFSLSRLFVIKVCVFFKTIIRFHPIQTFFLPSAWFKSLNTFASKQNCFFYT